MYIHLIFNVKKILLSFVIGLIILVSVKPAQAASYGSVAWSGEPSCNYFIVAQGTNVGFAVVEWIGLWPQNGDLIVGNFNNLYLFQNVYNYTKNWNSEMMVVGSGLTSSEAINTFENHCYPYSGYNY